MMGGEKTKRKWKLKAEITMTDPSPTPNSPVLLDSFRTFVSYPIFFFFFHTADNSVFRVLANWDLDRKMESASETRFTTICYVHCIVPFTP